MARRAGPLDATMPVVFTPGFLADLANVSPLAGDLLARMAAFYTLFYQGRIGVEGCVPHDVMALAWLTMPGVYMQKVGALAVSTEGVALGQTHFLPAGQVTRDEAWRGRPVQTVLLDTDPALFKADFFRTLAGFGLSGGT